jgi:amidase
VQAVFDRTVALLREHGHTIIEIEEMGIDWRRLYRAQGAVSGAMFAASIDDWTRVLGREPSEADMEPLAWASYRASKSLSSSQVGTGLQDLRLMSRQVLALWRNFDVLLSPVTLTPPPKIGYLDPVNVEPREFNKRQSLVFGYTPPYNMTGQPSFSLPMGLSSDKLPIGMMFTGRFGDEATLLRLAAQLEEARPWFDKRPPIVKREPVQALSV